MSDRSKKILWIAVAVSGFTLVVLLMAFILFPPNAASASKPFDLTGRSPGKTQSANDFSAFPSIVVQPSGSDASTLSENTTSSDSAVVVLPAPSAPATATGPSAGTATSKSAAPAAGTSAPAATPSPPPAASASAKPSAQKPAASSAPAAAPAPNAPAAKPASTTSAEYWIQVGSFSERATADKLKSEFESRGMTAIIATKSLGGRNYYQVKVGPYPSSNDAKKWITTVKSVPGASQDAFITTR